MTKDRFCTGAKNNRKNALRQARHYHILKINIKFQLDASVCWRYSLPTENKQRDFQMYTLKTRKLGFMVGCSVYGSRDWVIDLYKDGEIVCATIGVKKAQEMGLI